MPQGYHKAGLSAEGLDTLRLGNNYLMKTIAKAKGSTTKDPEFLLAYQVRIFWRFPWGRLWRPVPQLLNSSALQCCATMLGKPSLPQYSVRAQELRLHACACLICGKRVG